MESKLRIERPDWYDLYYAGLGSSTLSESESRCDKWFDTHVEPINKLLSEGKTFKYRTLPNGELVSSDPTHKALLINIEPIVKETAEDVLRDIIENRKEGLNYGQIKRAKKVLGDDDSNSKDGEVDWKKSFYNLKESADKLAEALEKYINAHSVYDPDYIPSVRDEIETEKNAKQVLANYRGESDD